jgi:hypothetical protein
VFALVTFDLTALVTSLSLLVGAVFTGIVGLQRKQETMDAAASKRLEQYERWRPKVRILIAELRDILSAHHIPEPPGIDDRIQFPPADEKVTTDE